MKKGFIGLEFIILIFITIILTHIISQHIIEKRDDYIVSYKKKKLCII